MAGSTRLGKLKWLCRRGMKELDILLERFVDRQQESLTVGSWPQFEALLQAEDDVLWDWLQDTSTPAASAYKGLLEEILRDPD